MDATKLTDRDKEVILLISQGYTYEEIARKYDKSRETVYRYWMRGIYDRAEIPDGKGRHMRLVVAAVRAGVI